MANQLKASTHDSAATLACVREPEFLQSGDKIKMNNSSPELTRKTYRLLIISPIPVHKINHQYETFDLWVEDLETNLNYVQSIGIICPRADSIAESKKAIPKSIQIIFQDEVESQHLLEKIVENYDVVMIGAGNPFWRMKIASNAALATKKLKRCLITSITSNRSKTTIMNAQGKSWLKKLKAHLIAWSINQTTFKLVGWSDGVLVIGEGVRESMQITHPNLYLETASWIQDRDVITESDYEIRRINYLGCVLPKIIIATRLEPMKGVHIGIEALAHLKKAHNVSLKLTILGKGMDLNNLEALVESNNLGDAVTFEGVLPYPDAFFAKIRLNELMLLTNLNDEQPRLIFDAISQGLIPVCPDSSSYLSLGLPKEVYYKRGDSESLALKLLELSDGKLMAHLLTQLRPFAFKYTINTMHQQRVNWVKSLLV